MPKKSPKPVKPKPTGKSATVSPEAEPNEEYVGKPAGGNPFKGRKK